MYHFIIEGPWYSDRAVYSDLNPFDGGQSLYPMATVFVFREMAHGGGIGIHNVDLESIKSEYGLNKWSIDLANINVNDTLQYLFEQGLTHSQNAYTYFVNVEGFLDTKNVPNIMIFPSLCS